jgi:hypothetical protein
MNFLPSEPMKLRDFASDIYINPAKLVNYALNLDHSRGGHKARVFRAALGYTIDNYQTLLNQIEELALDADAVISREVNLDYTCAWI